MATITSIVIYNLFKCISTSSSRMIFLKTELVDISFINSSNFYELLGYYLYICLILRFIFNDSKCVVYISDCF